MIILDGILKIPFGIYREESITIFINKFRNLIIQELSIENKKYSSIEINSILILIGNIFLALSFWDARAFGCIFSILCQFVAICLLYTSDAADE